MAEKKVEAKEIVATPPVTISISLDPEDINRIMQAASPLLGVELKIPVYRLALLVPGGLTVKLPFVLPKNYVCTRRYPLKFQSDYHSSDITVDVTVDRVKINPYALSFTTDFDVDFGTYYVKFKEVGIIITNETTTDAEITIQVTSHLMSYALYRSWYAKIVKKSYERLTEFAKS